MVHIKKKKILKKKREFSWDTKLKLQVCPGSMPCPLVSPPWPPLQLPCSPWGYKILVGININRKYDANLRKLNLAIETI